MIKFPVEHVTCEIPDRKAGHVLEGKTVHNRAKCNIHNEVQNHQLACFWEAGGVLGLRENPFEYIELV